MSWENNKKKSVYVYEWSLEFEKEEKTWVKNREILFYFYLLKKKWRVCVYMKERWPITLSRIYVSMDIRYTRLAKDSKIDL